MSIREIGADELETVLSAGARLIDVREVDEYQAGHVAGALLVPLGTVPDRVDAFEGDGPTYIICKSGARSMRAAEFLADRGLDVVNIAGGTMGWIRSGRSVVEGDQPS